MQYFSDPVTSGRFQDTYPAVLTALAYEKLPGHTYVFFHGPRSEPADPAARLPEDCHRVQAIRKGVIGGLRGCELAGPWGKVQAMRSAVDAFPAATYFLFLDSDVIPNPLLDSTSNCEGTTKYLVLQAERIAILDQRA